MNLAAFDLNLLRVFDAMMAERHVTRAGERIGLSQPAVSAALSRLRGLFNDELFVRNGHEMTPTARAIALAEPIADALRRVEFAIVAAAPFDPATARRDFKLRGVDYFGILLIPPLVQRIAEVAPGITVRCLDAQTGTVPQLLDNGLIDLAVELMHQFDDPIRSQFLLRERYVVIVSAEHPEIPVDGSSRVDEPLDIDLYCRFPHALHSFVGGTTGNVDAALAAIGRERHVTLSAPHFFTIVKAVAESRIIATIPERLARLVAPMFGISIYRPPVDLAPISLGMVWHRRSDSDPAQIWFRQQVLEAAHRMA